MSFSNEQGDAGSGPAPPAGRDPVLRLRGIVKHFGAVQALAGVDFEVHPAEVVALVGDNGAGKSTLVKIISGVYVPDAGTIRFDGQEVRFSSPADANRHGIETVYQDLALCDNLDVVQNMFLGREAVRRLAPSVELLAEERMERRALETLRDLTVVTVRNVRAGVAGLSGGQRQVVAIAKAVMWHSKVVLLDEPTAALGVAASQQVLALIRRLREQALGVVVISHNLREVFEVADRIVVLRLGRRVGTFERSRATLEEVVAAITGAAGGARA